ncbi:MAG: hypothetical protein KGZ25_05175 [Planctomycetes bacterium]|nr:hypothetical protein [Planctomycetota bacterium]
MPDEVDDIGPGSLEGNHETSGSAEGMFTLRSILFGAFMCVIVGLAGPYWTFYLHSSTLFLDYSVGGVMFMLFVLVLLCNGFIGLIWPKIAFKPGEFVVITAMMLVAGAITTMGLAGYLVPNLTAPYYLANSSNEWADKLWPHFPSWMVPVEKDGGIESIMMFYDGLRDQPDIWSGSWTPAGLWETGQNFVRATRAMPWKVWFHPLLFWGIFLMALYACMISLMALIRKQWIENERLTFPIAQVPQELCISAGDPWAKTSLFRQKIFWMGLAIPLIVCSMTALHKFYGLVPKVPISTKIRDIGPIDLQIRLSWAVLGFTFLIPNRVAFSIWALNLLSFAARSFIISRGLSMNEDLGIYGASQYPIMAHIGMGAMLVFVASSFYFARRHLFKAFKNAFGKGAKDYGRGEPSSYRTSFIVLAVSLIVMTIWLVQAGLSFFYAIVFLLAAIFIFYGLARVVAQCGVSVTIAPMIAPSFMTSTFGGANISTTGVTTLTHSWSWCSDIRTSVMSSSVHGMYLARDKARGLLWSLLGAALITFLVATLFTIWLGYRHGAANLYPWFFIGGPKATFNWGISKMTQAEGANIAGHVWTVGGGIMMIALTIAHRMFFWWPLHPVGFIISSVTWTDHLWFTVFLAWIIKALITKIGGNRVLRIARNFFLGIILGQFSAAGIWAVFDMFTGTVGHSVFWI